ncbi:MAG: DUF2310 family Zn-ribbon-containing protein [Cyanobacteriota bacterium]
MYYAECKIDINNSNLKEAIIANINTLLSSLYQNGQIFEDYNVAIHKNEIRVMVCCPEEDSLNVVYQNNYVNKYRSELERNLNSDINFKIIGHDQEFKPSKCCKKTIFYILYTNMLTQVSPLRCGDCFTPLPLYKIKSNDESLVYDILKWSSDYKACDVLYINSSSGEKFGLKQISEYNSKLSKYGILICNRITNAIGIPVYYYLFNNKKSSVSIDKKQTCPGCGRNWLLNNKLHNIFDFKCNYCYLLSNISTNI